MALGRATKFLRSSDMKVESGIGSGRYGRSLWKDSIRVVFGSVVERKSDL